ncbi:hypothetical protein BESB_046610 [Besnoitia besnoiti]|uniref:Uncharacterized protein n=1 Tax=Besnoitia besnoiti TaxID=94643 RepID=A0A2A9MF10_BESBE|nr:hypothetical protein BESB_046610 [Besnoitia besnoiti]PFH36469.1 hypothetical protein BESB_046610 [Besnoitia besnoiti]
MLHVTLPPRVQRRLPFQAGGRVLGEAEYKNMRARACCRPADFNACLFSARASPFTKRRGTNVAPRRVSAPAALALRDIDCGGEGRGARGDGNEESCSRRVAEACAGDSRTRRRPRGETARVSPLPVESESRAALDEIAMEKARETSHEHLLLSHLSSERTAEQRSSEVAAGPSSPLESPAPLAASAASNSQAPASEPAGASASAPDTAHGEGQASGCAASEPASPPRTESFLRQRRPPSLRLLLLVFCCGSLAAFSSVLGKLALDFHSDAPLVRASLFLTTFLAPSLTPPPAERVSRAFPAPGDSEGSPKAGDLTREDGPFSGAERQTHSVGAEGPAGSAALPEEEAGEGDAFSRARLPSSLLSLLHAVATNCVFGGCGKRDWQAGVKTPLDAAARDTASFSFLRFSFPAGISQFFSAPCEGVLRLPCGLLLLLAALRLGTLLVMVFSNTLLLHCHFLALFESSNAFIPSVLTFVFNFLLSGLFSLLVFREALSVRWLAGALSMLTGVVLLMSGNRENSESALQRRNSQDVIDASEKKDQ